MPPPAERGRPLAPAAPAPARHGTPRRPQSPWWPCYRHVRCDAERGRGKGARKRYGNGQARREWHDRHTNATRHGSGQGGNGRDGCGCGQWEGEARLAFDSGRLTLWKGGPDGSGWSCLVERSGGGRWARSERHPNSRVGGAISEGGLGPRRCPRAVSPHVANSPPRGAISTAGSISGHRVELGGPHHDRFYFQVCGAQPTMDLENPYPLKPTRGNVDPSYALCLGSIPASWLTLSTAAPKVLREAPPARRQKAQPRVAPGERGVSGVLPSPQPSPETPPAPVAWPPPPALPAAISAADTSPPRATAANALCSPVWLEYSPRRNVCLLITADGGSPWSRPLTPAPPLQPTPQKRWVWHLLPHRCLECGRAVASVRHGQGQGAHHPFLAEQGDVGIPACFMWERGCDRLLLSD